MKQVLIRSGEAFVEEVPAPLAEPGTVVVRVDHSAISVGTEMSGVRTSAVPLWKRALTQPQNVKKVFDMVASQGIAKTRSVVEGKLTAGNPSGYSAAGTVLAVGEGVTDLVAGERVACAGAQYAHHAEVIRVSRNLTVPVPEGLSFAEACTVTLGSIAMQGVRRADPTLGETFVVIGLGILGQITAQLLKANGCRVIGTDLDRKRIDTALELGMDVGLHPDDGDAEQRIARLTDGIGADGVIITAAGASDEIVSGAFKYCRKKGRVVLVGDVGLGLKREDFYAKELDFLISSSYGPGRYDRRYEEEGLDYPVGYVRWTENRNMAEYLRLIAEGRMNVKPLITKTFTVDEAGAAYAALKDHASDYIMVLLNYPADEKAEARVVPNPGAPSAKPGRVRLAVVGAGGFAKGMHLPNLTELTDLYQIRAIASRTGHNATATAKQYAAEYATTDYAEVLRDADVDAVLIATRHNLHAPEVLAGLRAGKHVLVEKPLALTREELAEIVGFYEGAGDKPPVLLTGFNRRFSPFALRMKELLADRTNPMILDYRMNAGYIPLDHWTQTAEGGGRNIGEACHIYDLFTYLTGAKVTKVDVANITPATGYYSPRDNFVATMTFDDGSVAKLTYTALGSTEFPKERLDVFADGMVLTLDDYKELTVAGVKAEGVKTAVVDKGQKEEVRRFALAIRDGGEWPIPLWQQEQAMRIAFDVEDGLGG